MYSLFLDTHANKIVVVIFKDEEILVKKEIETVYKHSECTMPIIIEALKEAKCNVKDINSIICVNGPGSFTGVRIGVTIAKMLAFTLKIPIKVMSSLLIKAVSFEHDDVTIIESEKNGFYIAKFNKQNDLIDDYKYYSLKEYSDLNINGVNNIEIDYQKVFMYANSLKETNPHLVNPLYIKKIEALKND